MSEPVAVPPPVSVVRRETGDVLVGRLPAAPAGLAVVGLPGAAAYVDPTDPGMPPAVVVADPQVAAPALERLFGEDVALAAGTVGDEPVQAPGGLTAAAIRLNRYALLRWLWSTGPLPLDRATLAFESAVAADAAGDVLDPDAVPPPDVADLAPLALAVARTLRAAGDDVAWPGVPGLLEDALDAVSRTLPSDDPMRQEVRHEAELRDAMRSLATGLIDWDRWDEMLLASTRPEGARHAGDDDPVRRRNGRGSVDWARVPPGVLDAGEGTVLWSVGESADGRVTVTVDVLAHQGSSAASGLGQLVGDDPRASGVLVRLRGDDGRQGLGFRVYVPGIGLPLATADLAPSDDGHWWSGTAELPVALLGDGGLLVDVHGSTVRGGPRLGTAAVPAEAMRWAARGTALLRLALAGEQTPREGVREPWEHARSLFAAVAAGEGPDAGLARRRQARCDAVLVAYLESRGETRTATRLRSRLAAVPDDVRPEDVAVPDLRDPGWAPSVAELGLLAVRSTT